MSTVKIWRRLFPKLEKRQVMPARPVEVHISEFHNLHNQITLEYSSALRDSRKVDMTKIMELRKKLAEL